jgi:hypothetical protein
MRDMPHVTISVSVSEQHYVTGCELRVAVTLTNTASTRELLLVQSPEADLPFEYELVSAEYGSFRLSKRLYEQAALEHGIPPLKPELQPLIPGESCTYWDDVSSWMTTPIPAAQYDLIVHWDSPNGERFTAAAVSVTLEAPHVEHHVCASDMTGQVLIGLFDHARGPSSTLYHRVSEYARPALGRGLDLHRDNQADSLAIACELDDSSQWRWYAWMSAEHLHGCIRWGTQSVRSLNATRVGISRGKLLPIGWQTRHAAGVFVVLGEAAGVAAVDLILIPQVGEPQHCTYSLQCPVPRLAAAGSYAPGLGVIELLLGFESAGRTSVLIQHIDFSLTDCPPPRVLLEVDGPLRALSVAPRITENSTCDVLVGDTLHRVPLVNGATQAYPLAPQPCADGWSLPLVPHPDVPVLARVNDTLTLARAKHAPTWTPVVTSAHGVSHATLTHLAPTDGSGEGTLAAAYFDGLHGYTVTNLGAE